MGQGPMTGRGAGYCAGYGVPGYANPWGGAFGGARGGGRGRGWRHGYHATGVPGGARGGWMHGAWPPPPMYAGPAPAMTAGDETASLREQSEYLEQALEDVRKRLAELESGSGE